MALDDPDHDAFLTLDAVAVDINGERACRVERSAPRKWTRAVVSWAAGAERGVGWAIATMAALDVACMVAGRLDALTADEAAGVGEVELVAMVRDVVARVNV